MKFYQAAIILILFATAIVFVTVLQTPHYFSFIAIIAAFLCGMFANKWVK